MSHTKACFVDESPPLLARERPDQWMTCRTACDEHRTLALLPDNENLFSFLARRENKTFPLEGSGLNYLINPITIKGIRAWCDFHFETPVLYEEIFPSNTYFDFYVQHAEDIQAFFYLFYQTHQKLQDTNSFFNTILAIRKENPATEKHLHDLIYMWTLQETLGNELKVRGIPWLASPDQAQEIFYTVYERLNEETVLTDVVNDMLRHLIELGTIRFAHL